MSARIAVADCIAWAEAYDGPLFHALLCDPPYHLTANKKGGTGEASLNLAHPAGRSRITTGGGFMGQQWDGGDLAYRPDTWRALARVLHPGAFGMAFASSRGWHRLAVAIEDAGLIIHPSIFGWVAGSGFPKATRVADAPAFDGHRYGRQALKPALEPIIVFQKPYSGRPVDCITATGAGALWIDGARIPTGDALGGGSENGAMPDHEGYDRPWRHDPEAAAAYGRRRQDGVAHAEQAGRWPANFYLQHAPECADRCVDDCPVRLLGEQSGDRPPGSFPASRSATQEIYGAGRGLPIDVGTEPHDLVDRGTAARFFYNADWSLDVAERLADSDPVAYVAKASRRERNAGCEGLEERVVSVWGGDEDDLSAGKKATLPNRNPHPTVKPLALARHLATLLLPPDAYAPRRIFCPFAGSGSEAIGAMLAGWDEVVGVELSEEYADIGRARLAWWEANRDKAPAAGAMRGKPAHSRGGRSMNGGRFAAEDAIKREDPAATQAALPLAEAGS